MKKLYSFLMILMLLVTAVPMSAFAEDFTGGSDWTVSFDGSKLNSSFKSADIDDAVYQLLPGDTVSIEIALKNTNAAETSWYMSNTILSSLEDSQSVADGGVYTYELAYVNPEGVSTLLYSSESVGGESTDTTALAGLHQATNSLDSYFYLDQLKKDEAGKITLKVALEGETQGNSYQNTLAKLQMTFAAEKAVVTTSTDDPKNSGTSNRIEHTAPTVTTPATTTPGTNTPTPGTPVSTTTGLSTVKTGDTSGPVLIVSIVALVLGLLCMFLAVKRMNNQRAAAGSPQSNTKRKGER